MAQVPYSPVPSVAPSTQGESGVNVRATEDAFGAAVGKANTHFGAQLERSSDEIFTRAVAIQTQLNDAAAKEADANYVMKSSDIYLEYSQLRGKDAIDRRQEYVDKLNSLREEVRGGLSNPASQRMYDASTRQQFARTVFAFSSHAKDQGRQYADQADEAVIRASSRNTEIQPDNFAQSATNLEKTVAAVRAQGQRKGLPPEAIEENVKDAQSGFIANQIQALSRQSPEMAFDMYKANKSLLNDKDRKPVEGIVLDRQRIDRASSIKDKVFFGFDPEKPAKTLVELQEEALEDATKYLEDDPRTKEAVRAAVENEWNRLHRQEREASTARVRLADNALSGVNSPNGMKPKTYDEIFAIPGMQQAYDKDDRVKKIVINGLRLNNKEPVVETPERMQRFQQIMGMSTSENSEERSKFLEIASSTLDIPDTRKREIFKAQQALIKAGQADPVMTKSYRQLVDLGMAPTEAKTNKDTVQQYRGALQGAITIWREQNKGMQPTLEDVKKIGSALAAEQPDQTRWFFNRTQPLWKHEPPKEYKELYDKEHGYKAGLPEQRTDFFRRRFEQLYSGQLKKTGKPQ